MIDYVTRNNISMNEDDDKSITTETTGESCDFDYDDEHDESLHERNIKTDGDTITSVNMDTSDSIEGTPPNSTTDSDFTDGHEAR
eukprot:scaffold149888_cov103-Cyclotella_meneghiniana.AAC.1